MLVHTLAQASSFLSLDMKGNREWTVGDDGGRDPSEVFVSLFLVGEAVAVGAPYRPLSPTSNVFLLGPEDWEFYLILKLVLLWFLMLLSDWRRYGEKMLARW